MLTIGTVFLLHINHAPGTFVTISHHKLSVTTHAGEAVMSPLNSVALIDLSRGWVLLIMNVDFHLQETDCVNYFFLKL